MKLAGWYENLNFFKKIVFVYVICGIIPIIGIMIYYGSDTYRLLMKQAYTDMNQRITVSESSLKTALEPYKNIIEDIKNDKKPNIQLNTDYTNVSYSDLAYYMNTTLDELKAIHPDIEAIHFYSNNETLPYEDHYFFPISDMNHKLEQKLNSTSDSVVVACRIMDNEPHVVMVSRMNYYTNDDVKLYIELQLSQDFLDALTYSEDVNQQMYLVDDNGLIISSSDDNQGNLLSDLVSDWDSVSTSEITTRKTLKNETILCRKTDMSMGLHLFLQDNKSLMMQDATAAPLRVAVVISIITILLFSFMYKYSKGWNQRLDEIIMALDRIGSGDFSQKLVPHGQAEFGQIETAVNEMGDQIDDLIQENYEKQLLVKSTELNLLQEQINPHFLYNALGVISSLSIREGGKNTTQSIRYLADFYRISLNKGRKVIHVSEEIDLLRNYMKIQMLRFSDYVDISYKVAPEINDYYTIKLLLQPLVENAIHHARDEEIFLHIVVRGYEEHHRICFDVEDDGMGIEPETLKRLREELLRQEEGFGLKNVDRRIKLNYGQDYGVTIFSEEGKGTRIHLEIPIVSVYPGIASR